MAEVSDFGKAFRAARAAKAKEFTFGGEKFHTRTVEEDTAYKAKNAGRTTPTKSPPAAAKPATPAPKPASAAQPRKAQSNNERTAAAIQSKPPAASSSPRAEPFRIKGPTFKTAPPSSGTGEKPVPYKAPKQPRDALKLKRGGTVKRKKKRYV